MNGDLDLFKQINNAVLDLQAAQFQTFHTPLKRLAKLLRHPDLDRINQEITANCNLDNFLQSQEKHGGMVGSERLELPDDQEQVLGLTLLLIEKFADDPDYLMSFGHTYFYSGKKIIGDIRAVVSQLIIPFVRDYQTYVEREGRAEVRLKIPTGNKVFVVHGHDLGARDRMARFLHSIDLEPIILGEQVNSGQTIIEKFELHAATANFAVILMTPDDVGGLSGATQGERARQNVIYELGYFAAKLGRGRVCLLRKGNVDMPTDLAGVIYTELDENDGWKLKLAKELKAAGFNIDANKALQ
jgi:hypothetical protein